MNRPVGVDSENGRVTAIGHKDRPGRVDGEGSWVALLGGERDWRWLALVGREDGRRLSGGGVNPSHPTAEPVRQIQVAAAVVGQLWDLTELRVGRRSLVSVPSRPVGPGNPVDDPVGTDSAHAVGTGVGNEDPPSIAIDDVTGP